MNIRQIWHNFDFSVELNYWSPPFFFFFNMPREFFSLQRNSIINRRTNKGKCIWPSRCNFPCDTQKSQFSFPWLHCLEFCSISWMVLGSSVSSIYLTTASVLHFQAGGFVVFVDTIGIVMKGLLIFFFPPLCTSRMSIS